MQKYEYFNIALTQYDDTTVNIANAYGQLGWLVVDVVQKSYPAGAREILFARPIPQAS